MTYAPCILVSEVLVPASFLIYFRGTSIDSSPWTWNYANKYSTGKDRFLLDSHYFPATRVSPSSFGYNSEHFVQSLFPSFHLSIFLKLNLVVKLSPRYPELSLPVKLIKLLILSSHLMPFLPLGIVDACILRQTKSLLSFVYYYYCVCMYAYIHKYTVYM